MTLEPEGSVKGRKDYSLPHRDLGPDLRRNLYVSKVDELPLRKLPSEKTKEDTEVSPCLEKVIETYFSPSSLRVQGPGVPLKKSPPQYVYLPT